MPRNNLSYRSMAALGYNRAVRCHCACSASGTGGWGCISWELSKPLCVVLSVSVGVAAAQRYQLACQAFSLLVWDTLYFLRPELPNHVQRAFCSCLNICLGCILMYHWIPSTLGGPFWAEGNLGTGLCGWGPGSRVWRDGEPGLLSQYWCWHEWDWVRQHGWVERAGLWALTQTDSPWVWIIALLLTACPWTWYVQL